MADKPRSAAVDFLVYCVVRIVVCVLQALSFQAACAFARFLAWVAYRVDRRHRLVAQENIAKAFPGKYSDAEIELLGEESIGFISFLDSAGVLPAPMREMVIDRATALGDGPIELDDLKVIVLMVFWSLGEEPDALILDELFVDPEDRLIH